MWGSSFVASKVCINQGMMQFEIVFYRFLFGSILTGIIFHRELRHISRSALRTGILLGLVTSAGFAVEMFGITLTQTTKASFLASTNIVLLPLLYSLALRRFPKGRTVCAALLVLTGVGFLSLTDGFGRIVSGDLLMLLAAVTYALNSMIVIFLARDDSRIQLSFLQFAVTAVIMGVLTLFQGTGGAMDLPAAGGIAYLTVFPTVVCFLIKNIAFQYVEPVRCTLILASESIFCAVISRVLFHDVLTGQMALGIVLILTGILLEILRRPEAAPAQTQSITDGAEDSKEEFPC